MEEDKLDVTNAETHAQNAHAPTGNTLKNVMDAAQFSKENKTGALADVEDELNEANVPKKLRRRLVQTKDKLVRLQALNVLKGATTEDPRLDHFAWSLHGRQFNSRK